MDINLKVSPRSQRQLGADHLLLLPAGGAAGGIL